MKIAQFFNQINKSQNDGFKIGNSNTLSASATDESNETAIKSQQDQKINRLLSKYNVKSTPETQKGIDDFFKSAQGTDQEKLNTLETALSKGITPSKGNLEALHSALNEAALTSDQVDMLSVESTPTSGDTVKVIEGLDLPEKVKMILKALTSEGYSLKEASALLSKYLGGSQGGQSPVASLVALIQNMDPEKLKALLSKFVSSNPTLSHLSSSLETSNAMTNSVFDTLKGTDGAAVSDSIKENQQASKMETAKSPEFVKGDESVIDPDMGRDVSIKNEGHLKVQTDKPSDQSTEGIDTLTDPIEALKKHLSDKSASQEEVEGTEASRFVDTLEGMIEMAMSQISDQLSQISETFEIKQYLVKETSQMGIEMKAQFDAFKAEVSSQFEQALEAPVTKMEDLVSAAIETIDKMITRKEVTMYATMQTERDLLVMSSELKDATNLLQEGKVNEASQIVEKAFSTIKSLYFEPDQSRVQLFVTQKADMVENMISDTPDAKGLKLQTMLSELQDQAGVHHARDVVETLRFMGNNHESEVVSMLEGKGKSEDHALIRDNIKEILMKMSKEESEQRQVTSTDKSLMNLAGQQMMNDRQQDGKRPFYFFNYPIQEADEINEMKVYVSGNQSQSKVDWQNSQLYFGVTLNNLGDAGIKVQVRDGNLNVSVQSDAHETLTLVLQDYQEQFEAAGFKSIQIQGKPFVEENALKSVTNIDFDATKKSEEANISNGKVDFKV